MENCFLVSYDRLCTPEVPTENVLVLAIGKRESGAGEAVEEKCLCRRESADSSDDGSFQVRGGS